MPCPRWAALACSMACCRRRVTTHPRRPRPSERKRPLTTLRETAAALRQRLGSFSIPPGRRHVCSPRPRFTKGMLHPTIQGHAVYRNQLVAAIRPFLPSPLPAPAGLLPPTFNANITGTRGANGWLTTSGGVLTVTATAGANNVRIGGASVTVDGTAGCGLGGATCTTQLTDATLTAPGQYAWAFNLTAEGMHHLRFSGGDQYGQVANFEYEVKLDLHDRTTPSATPATAPNGSGWYRGAADVTFDATDTLAGAGVANVEYHVDGGPAAFAAPGIAVCPGRPRRLAC
jgi:hypothetical protein